MSEMSDKNTLDKATSPYLLQHADNPVHWQEWSADILKTAAKQDKPLLVSIGYAACHWCHVMAHESFEDEDIAAAMNENFINIKIDREERPDLDHIYQSALAMMGQQGGWPLTMFCTPEGKPFWGGTYFPPRSMMGRPGFPDVLKSVAQAYQNDKETVDHNVKALEETLDTLAKSKSGDENFLTDTLLEDIGDQLLTYIDREKGGLRGAPKFPNPSLLEFLWRNYTNRGDQTFKQAVVHSLTSMVNGGIYDHLGGGFARYSVDEDWFAPHFEKMLYDNALLISLMTEVWRDTQTPLFEVKIRETVNWALREMRVSEKGSGDSVKAAFGCSLDADSAALSGHSEEGAYYTWTADEIDSLLDTDTARIFKQAFNIREDGNWEEGTEKRGEGVNILYRTQQDEDGELATLEEILNETAAALLEAREKRPRPHYDDKVLTDWNGMMIAALAEASRIFEEPGWLEEAQSAFEFILSNSVRDKQGHLYHSWRDGRQAHAGIADDYSWMIRAALSLYEVSGEAFYLDHARKWAEVLDKDFWDADNHGYFLSGPEATNLVVRPKTIADTATPSANGIMLGNLARLAAHDPENRHWAERGEEQVAAFAGEIEGNIYGLFSYFTALDTFRKMRHIEITGLESDSEIAKIREYLRHKSCPDLIWLDLFEQTESGKADLKYCYNGSCQELETNLDKIKAHI